jgi:RNA polymerase sigma factor (sigma-70 family)
MRVDRVDVSEGTELAELESLYRMRYVSLVRLARVIVGSDAVGEELAQEAFVRLQGAWGRVEQPDRYVKTILVNLCRTWIERTVRERQHAVATDLIALPTEIDETWQAVQRLPGRYRTVLALRFYDDMTEVEIARILDMRIGTVKSIVHRGLAKLREELA